MIKLNDFNGDKQAIFDHVAKAILEQGRASVNSGGDCVYFGSDSKGACKCAIGHLASDSEAHELQVQAGGHNVAWLLGYDRVGESTLSHEPFVEITGDSYEFLLELQRAHDYPVGMADYIESFKRNMLTVALKFNLSAAAVI